MIKTKGEKRKKGKAMMKKISILSIFIFLYVPSFNVNAETKRDCSQYSSKTFMGLLDKKRCEAGKPPRKKWNISKKLKKLNPLSKD
jgi:hypothetical protein